MNKIKDLKIYDNTMFHLQEVEKSYFEYIKKLQSLPPWELQKFTNYLESQEIVSNQTVESENSFLTQIYSHLQQENPIDYLCKMLNKGINLDKINRLHTLLIFGTKADQEQNARYRNGEYSTDYEKWVGYYQNQERIIQYIPPDPSVVMEEMHHITHFMSNSGESSPLYNIFIHPMIFHLKIAALQPFGDGNTRTARFLQYGKMWQASNEVYGSNFARPVMYISHRYKAYAKNYRKNIQNVVINKGHESWNHWFEFNLNMMDETLYKFNNDLKLLTKRNYSVRH